MEWPNTQTFDTRHIYNIVFYYAKTECLDILCQVKCLYDWDYPDAPMDLCFYKDGYCWFAVTAHEGFSYLYTDDLKVVKDLKKLGVNLEFKKNTSKIFYIDLNSRRTIDQFTAEIGSFGIRTITPLQSELLCVLMQIHVAVDMKSIHVSLKCKIIKSAMKRLPGGG